MLAGPARFAAKKNMKLSLVWLLVGLLSVQMVNGQSKNERTYRNFPLVLSVQFHRDSYPLKDVRTNFKNLGFGIGSEISLGSGHSWAQQFTLSTYRDKEAGNGVLLYTQSAWRPTIVGHVYTELKAGFGLNYVYAPEEPYRVINGKSYYVGDKARWLFTAPVGISIGYNKFSRQTYVAPFASYQVLLTPDYVKGITIMSHSLFQVGARIHFAKID